MYNKLVITYDLEQSVLALLRFSAASSKLHSLRKYPTPVVKNELKTLTFLQNIYITFRSTTI